jgi:hypothetical protein
MAEYKALSVIADILDLFDEYEQQSFYTIKGIQSLNHNFSRNDLHL